MPKSKPDSAAATRADIAPLTNVHDAIQRAVLSDRNKTRLVNATVKIDPLKKQAAEGLLAKQGTSLSSFVRECVDGLLLDYMGPKAFRDLEGATPT